MEKVKIAIIGLGVMGKKYMAFLLNQKIKNAKLIAVCSGTPEKLDYLKQEYGEQLRYYSKLEEVFNDPTIDAVLITTPHFSHPDLAQAALDANKHFLVEKPIGVYTKNVEKLNQTITAHQNLTCALVFNQRTNPVYQKAKQLVDNGDLGDILRTNWITTDWYRGQDYYDAVNWRGTWAQDGGGVLLNQAVHQLDLWQWLCGLPKRVCGQIYPGKRRQIEVETEASIYVEYENDATGFFTANTIEPLGSNRLEISGSKGKLVIENGKLRWWQMTDENRATIKEMPVNVLESNSPGQQKVLQNFVNAILFDEPLIAPAIEGIRSLSLINATYLSAWQNAWIDLPLDSDKFLWELKQRT